MPGKMVFMRCNTDHHGVALVGGAKEGAKAREMHHMAFEVSSIDEVLAARAHLEANGVKIDFEGRRRAGCQVAVEFRDPDGHFLEIYWGLDQVGTGGHVRPPEEWREAFSLEEAIDNPPEGQNTTLRDPALRRS
jgi:catechol 2,3-dioxygenase